MVKIFLIYNNIFKQSEEDNSSVQENSENNYEEEEEKESPDGENLSNNEDHPKCVPLDVYKKVFKENKELKQEIENLKQTINDNDKDKNKEIINKLQNQIKLLQSEKKKE